MIGEDNLYSINQFPSQEITIPLSILTGSSENHTISFSGVSDFLNMSCIYLEDLFTGDVYNLETTPVITLFINDTTTVPRFLLKFGAPTFVEGYDLNCYDNGSGYINIGKNSDSLFNINWYDQFGYLLSSENNIYQISTLNNLDVGLYIIESTDHLCGNRVDSIYISEPPEITSLFEPSSNIIYLPVDPTEVFFDNQSSNADSFLWEF